MDPEEPCLMAWSQQKQGHSFEDTEGGRWLKSGVQHLCSPGAAPTESRWWPTTAAVIVLRFLLRHFNPHMYLDPMCP